MEKMPYQPELDRQHGSAQRLSKPDIASSDWREKLPLLAGPTVTLRELELPDAASLLAMLNTEEVSRFISPPPTTVEGFERFILWAQRERAEGRYACFAVVPQGMDTAVGLFQVRQLEPSFASAEWGFAIGSDFWGTGVFVDGARMVVDFASTSWACRGLRRGPPCSTVAATPHSGRSEPLKKGFCVDRSSETAFISTRSCGRFSPASGASPG